MELNTTKSMIRFFIDFFNSVADKPSKFGSKFLILSKKINMVDRANIILKLLLFLRKPERY